MGLGDFVSGIKDAAVNVGKGAIWAARPDHWDDIAEGVGKAGEFVVEHPGQVAHIAGEVGKGILKDQLDPVNLAINAGLLAATVATGGAAAPAFIAKLGLGVKSVEAGIEAGKAVETGAEVIKGVQAGVKGLETAGEVAKTVQTGAKAAEAVGEGAKALEAGTDVAEGVKTGSRAMRVVDKALGMEPGKVGQLANKVMNPLETSEKFGMAAYRERAAQRMLEAGGEAPSLARQATAALVQGGGKGAGGLTQLEGMSDKVYEAQKWAKRAGQAGKRMDQLGQAERAVEIGADPMKAVETKAYEEADKRGMGRDAGYTDRGQTAESLYGGGSDQTGAPTSRSQVFAEGSGSQLAIGSGNQLGGQVGGGGGGAKPPGQPPSTAGSAVPPSSNGGMGFGQPASSTSSSSTASTAAPTGRNWKMQGWSQPGAVSRPEAIKGGSSYSRGQHFWEGPRSQWAGGVGANYDWRPVDPLRKINAPTTTQAGRYKDAVKSRGAKPASEGPSDDTSTMSSATPGAAPDDSFSPEVPKSGMYALSTGQAPAGTAFPTTRLGEGSSRTRHNLGNVRTLSQPIGAIGPGTKRTGNAVIDADSSSPGDLGFDKSGQGYFDFGNMGSGLADVGPQPNTSPMYSQGSRTSRRSTGMLGV